MGLKRCTAVGLVLCGASTVTGTSVSAQQGPAPTLAFTNVSVVPMDRERVLPAQTVVVQGSRIAAMGPTDRIRVPAGATIVDGTGKFLIPGLGDMHVHIAYPNADTSAIDDVLFAYLANGVTTVRDMHSGGKRTAMGNKPTILAVRKRVESGAWPSPRIYTSGDVDYSSPGAAAESVVELAAAGHDFIKLSFEDTKVVVAGDTFRLDQSPLARPTLDSIVATARRVGRRIGAHVPEGLGVRALLDAGIATTEHLYGYPEYLFGVSGQWSVGHDGGAVDLDARPVLDTARWMRPEWTPSDSLLRALAVEQRKAGTWSVPTLFIHERLAFGLDGYLESLPRDTAQAQVAMRARISALSQVLRRWAEVNRRVLHAFREAGTGLLLGTDEMGSLKGAGFAVHAELAKLVEVGFTPYEALSMGTKNVAQFLGTLDSTGTVGVGKRADLVLLNGSPLQDIGYTAGPAGVVLGGRWYSRAVIDARLEAVSPKYVAELRQVRDSIWRH